ncbi:unnamed protein product [Albugo candida]|uniref:Uncharacterized protein n=1 Tax=Albugo candida TaxID=65357 RepID=A0A024G567_9STRA|nr:unnamed protein product [Albugo candida]|eukprot:CCI41713.1 unnamed protein product [Albugo candida]
MHRSPCSLCRLHCASFYCPSCINELLQQRRVLLQALKADVAVLRKKIEISIHQQQHVVQAEYDLNQQTEAVESLTTQVLHQREKLCHERLKAIERISSLEHQSEELGNAQQVVQKCQQRSEEFHVAILQSLDVEMGHAKQSVRSVRGEKIRQLFALFGLQTESSPSAENGVAQQTFFRSIVSLPVPISGRFEIVPVKVMAAAFGKIVHLLQCLTKYLNIEYPHPMVLNGSYSTIGTMNEGAGCHILYPDGSPGFQRGVEMLYENISCLCKAQNVPLQNLHETDILGNLLKILP